MGVEIACERRGQYRDDTQKQWKLKHACLRGVDAVLAGEKFGGG